MKAIVDAVHDDSHRLQQLVYDFQCAVKHKRMKLVNATAGVFARSGKVVDKHIVKNIHGTIQFARKTDSMYGRTCYDRRSLVHSILLSCLPSPTATTKGISLRKMSKRVGIHWVSIYKIV